MTDKGSKAKHHSDLQTEDAEKDVFTKTESNQHTFDHLQDDFNRLISEPSAPYEEPADAFNDLADAFSTDTNPSIDPKKGFNDHLDESLDDFTATAPQISADSIDSTSDFIAEIDPNSSPALANNSFIDDDLESLSHLNSPFADEPLSDHSLPKSQLPIFESDEVEPHEFGAIADQFEANESSPDTASNASFENESAVFADLSESNNDAERPKSYLIAFASIIVMATAGGIYWYTMGSIDQSTEQSVQIIEGEQLESPSPTAPSSETVLQSSSAENLESTPPTLSTSDAIKLLTSQHQTTQHKPTIEQKQEPQATDSPVPTVQTTPIKQASTKKVINKAMKPVVEKPTKWAIVAAVNSNKLARQYVARLHAKHMDSEAIKFNNNGKVQHFVRIKGFSSKHSAQKRLDKLSKIWTLQNAKVQQFH